MFDLFKQIYGTLLLSALTVLWVSEWWHMRKFKMKDFYTDYKTEPIGGDNPYHRCVYCKRSEPEINGQLNKHKPDCQYRLSIEASLHPSEIEKS